MRSLPSFAPWSNGSTVGTREESNTSSALLFMVMSWATNNSIWSGWSVLCLAPCGLCMDDLTFLLLSLDMDVAEGLVCFSHCLSIPNPIPDIVYCMPISKIAQGDWRFEHQHRQWHGRSLSCLLFSFEWINANEIEMLYQSMVRTITRTIDDMNSTTVQCVMSV